MIIYAIGFHHIKSGNCLSIQIWNDVVGRKRARESEDERGGWQNKGRKLYRIVAAWFPLPFSTSCVQKTGKKEKPQNCSLLCNMANIIQYIQLNVVDSIADDKAKHVMGNLANRDDK
jgi:hypothetical protein